MRMVCSRVVDPRMQRSQYQRSMSCERIANFFFGDVQSWEGTAGAVRVKGGGRGRVAERSIFVRARGVEAVMSKADA